MNSCWSENFVACFYALLGIPLVFITPFLFIYFLVVAFFVACLTENANQAFVFPAFSYIFQQLFSLALRHL